MSERSPAHPGTVRAGGRTRAVRDAVLRAALEELAASSFAELTVERIAARAGIHKTTVYRRWASKEGVLAEAIADLVGREIPLPPDGDIAAGLTRAARAVVDLLTSTSPATVGAVRALFSGAADEPRIAALKRDFFERRYAEAGDMVEAGIRRGELPPDTDARELVGLVMAPIYYRFLVTHEPLSQGVADRAVETALAALRAGACRTTREPGTG